MFVPIHPFRLCLPSASAPLSQTRLYGLELPGLLKAFLLSQALGDGIRSSSGLTNATYDATIPAQRSRDNTKFNEGAAAGRQYRSMSFLERAGYSIYTSIVIEAPISHVWRVATDIEALPERITSLVSAERIEDDRVDRAVVGGKPNPARRASFAIDDDVHIDYDAMEALIHSRWKMTKLDPILQKPLHFITTFTQISVTKEKRSVSGSVSSIGGVTSTVKRTIEPIDNGSGQEACRLTALPKGTSGWARASTLNQADAPRTGTSHHPAALSSSPLGSSCSTQGPARRGRSRRRPAALSLLLNEQEPVRLDCE
ncbi:hypothetical protein THAOC_19000 [Thalassiosira oceanica]|uniref:Coenzyme Q-binding protein COQ10 START domain-containing protein n=1 Tax=Thalassiosira oceanica TaxID=159749 RepID=K0S3F6_THAOC|nr:hypothetical protein THAOC_19000 [Thalassiosira oceanica]|eukprot:EJK60608.1 hypothetical protein THAOC_19000 [Thalassiosira oceanica]